MQPKANVCPVVQKIWDLYSPPTPTSAITRPSPAEAKLPRISTTRLAAASGDQNSGAETFLYLAYGSNLSAETFKGKRGIKPLSAVNVHVPSLDLTFDLPGIPYTEPCFANTQYRRTKPAASIPESSDYHKTRWHKGLVGVVYEVTPEDYRIIIATEGGGASYQDVVVQCYVLPDGSKTVDPVPNGVPFLAHTLLCPLDGPDTNRISRPDPNYAQASARYLKLITDGAEEHDLPDDYMAYLYDLRAYTVTSARQRMGQLLVMTLLFPIVMAIFALGKMFAGKDGKIPEWLAQFMGRLFRITWKAYDVVFKDTFGDGERTVKEKERDGNEDSGLQKKWDEKKMLHLA
ncbi:gliotoxin biosynthesis protein [Rutstroemia sp. NJR-2017a BVV2]|nr:gliotoxin biosynthesis protein [Rutstroemia sp. NJR-2017a BVV2]PQE18350.1 gliotoxin biosynthesis protein [Rutstroemia sp. NJR-2017a BVV2]